MVLLLTLLVTGVVILFAASMSASVRTQLALTRDEAESLRAEMASESGLEFARRQLALDPAWKGTSGEGVTLAGGSSFVVAMKSVEDVGGGVTEASCSVTGHSGEGVHRFGTVLRVSPSTGGAYPYALLFLGQNVKMSDGQVNGDLLLADKAYKVNDWLFDSYGDGYYADSHGPDEDGDKDLGGTEVDGTVYKYRDDVGDYQTTGKEVLIESNTNMPSWDLDELAQPGPGKVILTNPHNVGNKAWNLDGQTFEETVVINLLNKQTVTLTNCTFKGGLVVLCPDTYDFRSGSRNLVHLKKGTTIGGGSKGAAPNIGLIAPGGNLKNETNPNVISGFSLVNEVDLFRNSTINGQLVILNDCKDMRKCTFNYDADVVENLPPWFGYRAPASTTEILSLYEDFE